jgi:(heptosyl)LPS beta-1,4-glucosyltransferase
MHHSFRSFAAYAGKMERYSTWWAMDRHAAGRTASALTVLGHTVGRFVRMYVLRGGFLDGGHGLVLALLASFSVYQKYAKLWEFRRRRPDPA